MRIRSVLVPWVAVAVALTACGGDDAAQPSSTGGELSGTLTVFAAASLTDVFGELGDRLTADNPDLEIQFSFAGSSALATQLAEGAPADVFASADDIQMTRVQDEGLIEEAEVFVENALMLAVPLENPRGIVLPEGDAGIPSLDELITADMTIAVCAPEVPCGAAAAEVLDAAGLSDAPDTYEDDVRAVLTKVQLGEVDGGLVYLSDVHAAEDSVLAYAFSESEQAINRYPIGVLASSADAAAARAFVDLVLSDEGQQVFADAGFLPPS
jgi:molybdate transport system substrate-binding protein